MAHPRNTRDNIHQHPELCNIICAIFPTPSPISSAARTMELHCRYRLIAQQSHQLIALALSQFGPLLPLAGHEMRPLESLARLF